MNPIECPECGGPCESDHNLFSCHTCKRCWPKGHGWEQEWKRKDRVSPDACPTTGETDCPFCDGEFCETHGSEPCECDTADRHWKKTTANG